MQDIENMSLDFWIPSRTEMDSEPHTPRTALEAAKTLAVEDSWNVKDVVNIEPVLSAERRVQTGWIVSLVVDDAG